MVGREGMLGAQVALDVTKSPLRALVQGRGSAWRVDVEPFRAELAAARRCSWCCGATCLRAHGAAGGRRPACATT
jgi:hypothetical protein